MKKHKLLAFIACNLLLFILEFIGLIICYIEVNTDMFFFYTQLSNIFLGIAALINAIAGIKAYKNKKPAIPNSNFKLFHAAASATTVTITVVICILSFMYGDLIALLTRGSMLFTHTLCPILGIIIHCYFAPRIFKPSDALRALIFTLLYAIIIISLNLLRIIRGPYPFLYIYDQPLWTTILWIIVIFGIAYALARLILIGKLRKSKVQP